MLSRSRVVAWSGGLDAARYVAVPTNGDPVRCALFVVINLTIGRVPFGSPFGSLRAPLPSPRCVDKVTGWVGSDAVTSGNDVDHGVTCGDAAEMLTNTGRVRRCDLR